MGQEERVKVNRRAAVLAASAIGALAYLVGPVPDLGRGASHEREMCHAYAYGVVVEEGEGPRDA